MYFHIIFYNHKVVWFLCCKIELYRRLPAALAGGGQVHCATPVAGGLRFNFGRVMP